MLIAALLACSTGCPGGRQRALPDGKSEDDALVYPDSRGWLGDAGADADAHAHDARPAMDATDAPRGDVSPDASPPRDGTASDSAGDGSVDSAPARDSSVDAAPPCSAVCGDVDGDGKVTATDVTLLVNVLANNPPPNACQQANGDVDGDGQLDDVDRRALAAVVDGRANTPSCGSRCSNACGDTNGDALITPIDALRAIHFSTLSTVPTVCELLAADIDGDGVVSSADANAISAAIGGPTGPTCLNR